MSNRQARSSGRPSLNRVLRRAHLKVALVAVVLAGVTMTTVGLLALRAYAEHNLLLVARSLSYTVEAAVVFRDADAVQEVLELIAETAEVGEARISDRDGNELTRWVSPGAGWRASIERVVSDVLQPAPVTLPITHNGQTVGRLELSGSARSLTSFLIHGFALLFACLLLSAVGTFYLSRQVIKGIVRPLRNLAKVAHAVRYDGSFDERVPSADIAELNDLGEDFNDLLDELKSWRASLHEENAILSYRASHDSLTGLANRAYFSSRLKRVIRDASQQPGEQVALLYIDCDGFKHINDTLGHSAGDEVLIELAARIKGQLRKDDLLARLGGDEFAAIIHPCFDLQDVARIARGIQSAMDVPMQLQGGHELTLSLSVGVAAFPDHVATADELLAHADAAMYKAKRASHGQDRATPRLVTTSSQSIRSMM